jgi:hypothetical protein
MNVPLNAHEISIALRLAGGAHIAIRAMLGAILGVSLAMSAGCGDGTGLKPEPIPEKLFEARFTNPANDCGAANIDPFSLLILPQNGGTTLLGIADTAIKATVDNGTLTYSVPFQVDDPKAVVTVGAEWAFSDDRTTFSGPETFAVALGGNPVSCTFTFTSSGSLATAPGAPPNLPSGQPTANIGSMETRSRAPRAAASRLDNNVVIYGPAGAVDPDPDTECFASGANGSHFLSIFIDPPLADARASVLGKAEDWIYFQWNLYYAPDAATAALGQVTQLAQLLQGGWLETPIASAPWFYHNSFTPPPPTGNLGLYWQLNGPSYDYQSTNATFNATAPGVYYTVYILYWSRRYAQDDVGPAWAVVFDPTLCTL